MPGDRVADHGPHDVRVDAPRLRRLGGGPGHRARLPDLLRLPDPLDPPGLRRGRPRHGDRRPGRGPRPRARPAARPRSTCGSWRRATWTGSRSAASGVPDAEVEVRRGMLGPDTLATLIYTSGTTGRPKGCVLTHGNFFAEVDNAIELLYPVFKAKNGRRASASSSSPCSHVFGRMVAIACIRARVRLGHAPSLPGRGPAARPGRLPADLPAGHPVHAGEGLQHRPRKAESGRPGRLLRPRRRVARRYGEASRPQTGAGLGPGARPAAARALYDPLVYRRIRAPWAAGSATPSAAAPRSAAASPPSTPARASRSSRATG